MCFMVWLCCRRIVTNARTRSLASYVNKHPEKQSCEDLLVVDTGPHPVFLIHSVDFLHRTVRDFLRDNFQVQLRTHLGKKFDPLVSLCNICLCFLKGLAEADSGSLRIVNRIIGLTDELLYYAHEVEKRHLLDTTTP
jgi:hypothetical protein